MLLFNREHTLAYVSDLGKVFAFGSGTEGQLGNGGTHNQLIPRPMKLPSNEELKFGKFFRSTGFGINKYLCGEAHFSKCITWARKEIFGYEGSISKRWFRGFFSFFFYTCKLLNICSLIYQVKITISFLLALQIKINVDLK